ncbi:Tat pathway signal sequence domain protein, partial [Sphingobacterium spiritivorum ATCC 33300]
MKRRSLLQLLGSIGVGAMIPTVSAKADRTALSIAQKGLNDREYWVSLLDKMAAPILDNISKQQLRKIMPMEVSPVFDSRDPGVGYLEAFGRLMSGLAPWLALPADNSSEGQLR